MPGQSFGLAAISQEIDLGAPGNHNGITTNGDHFFIAQAFQDQFVTYDSSFTHIATTTVSGSNDLRSIAYDPFSGNLFVGDSVFGGKVREVTVGGDFIGQFDTMRDLEGMTLDPRDGTLWLAAFSGRVEHMTRDGALISSFTSTEQWSGITIDPVSGTLILMNDDDLVFELETDGSTLDVLLDSDQIRGNGLGLHYDASVGQLLTTSQSGTLTFFDLPGRAIPEPSAALLVMIGSLGLFVRRRGRGFREQRAHR